MYNLGVLYIEGRGVVQDAVEVCVSVCVCKVCVCNVS